MSAESLLFYGAINTLLLGVGSELRFIPAISRPSILFPLIHIYTHTHTVTHTPAPILHHSLK